MKNRRQRGELALTLSLLGIFITVLGVGLGARMSKDIQQSTSRASGGTYTYKSTLEIRDENGAVIPWESGMTWTSNLQSSGVPEKSAGDIKMPNDPKAHVIYDATGPNGVPEKVQNFSATITLNIPDKYEIVKSFCENRAGTSCVGVQTGTGSSARTIPNIRITSGAEIVYGVVIRQAGSPDPSCRVKIPECKPKNVRFDQVSENNVTIKWDNPANCPAYVYNQDRFWIDVIRPGENGTKDSIVCATDSGDTEGTCTLGKAVPAGREIDKNSQEFTSKEWDQNRSYTLKVYLHNSADSCLSDSSGVSFSYTSRPPKPTVTGVPTAEPITPTPTAEPTATTTPLPTALQTLTPTPEPTKTQAGDTATVQVKVNYNGLHPESSKVKHQFYLETCDDDNGTVVNCGAAPNKKTGVVTLIKSDAKKRFYGMSLQDIPVGKKRIVLRHLIDGKESRTLRASTTQCNHNIGSQYECPLNLTKGQSKEVFFDVFFNDSQPEPTDMPQPTPFPTIPPTEQSCKHISGNGPVRVVFLPDGFKDQSEFEQLVTTKTPKILGETNAKQYQDKMTYLIGLTKNRNFGCGRNSSGFFSCLDSKGIHEYWNTCHADSIVVVINHSLKGNRGESFVGAQTAFKYEFLNILSKESVITIDSSGLDLQPMMLAHEFGHAFAHLADEFILPYEPSYYMKHSANCSELNEDKGCKWGRDAGCIKGCTKAEWYRPSETSAMQGVKGEVDESGNVIGLDMSNIFNKPSLDALGLFFEKATSRVKSLRIVDEKGIVMNSIKVSLEQDALDSLRLSSVQYVSNLYHDEGERIADGERYDVIIKNMRDENLFVTSIGKKSLALHTKNPPELIPDYDLYLPFFPEADHIVITNEKGETILTINLADYGPMTAVEGASACGNSFCDAALGETATSCRADCGAHLAYSELERADINGDGVVNGVDLALVIDTNTYRLSADGDIDGDLQTDAIDYTLLLKWMGTETQ